MHIHLYEIISLSIKKQNNFQIIISEEQECSLKVVICILIEDHIVYFEKLYLDYVIT